MADGPEVLRVGDRVTIPVGELQWRFSRSGGPGGQHANTSDTRVEVRFDVAGSPSLAEADRARLRARLGDEVRVSVADSRSQACNRELALERLAERLADGLTVTRSRRPTRPSRSSVERRLKAKRQRSERKATRRRVDPD